MRVKAFACGDVVPGCRREFLAPSLSDVLDAVARHATQDHGIEPSPELVALVVAHTSEVEPAPDVEGQ